MIKILNNNRQVCSCPDENSVSSVDSVISTSQRNLVTQQTGSLLVTLGKMFITLPAFNNHIDSDTGELLIDIGRKLKKTKS